jgi:ABC-type transporter MlaC component
LPAVHGKFPRSGWRRKQLRAAVVLRKRLPAPISAESCLAGQTDFSRPERDNGERNPAMIMPVFLQLHKITTSIREGTMKKLLIPLIASLFVLFTNTSYAYTDYYAKKYAPESDPVSEIKSALEDINNFSKNKDNVHPAMLRSFLENKIFPHFDFDSMASWITGPYARYMSAEDRDKFKSALRETLLSSLAKHLSGFSPEDTKVTFYRTQYRGQDEAIVRAAVTRGDRRPDRLEFLMQKGDRNWQIIDIKANYTSARLFYRKHFIAELREYDRQSEDKDFKESYGRYDR